VITRYRSTNSGATFTPVAPDPTVIRIPRTTPAHNGGDIAFGDDDFLYITSGDGGADPRVAQDLSSLLGKILRIDVSATPYANPPDNPFAGSAGRDEIWAFGFRNPWRMSFDQQTGALWTGDVGASAREEIDRVTKGGNYGWPCFEGDLPFDNGAVCPMPLEPPDLAVSHSDAASLTGGYVYRGNDVPELRGAYVYGDWGSGRMWALHFSEQPPRVEVLDSSAVPGLNISAFGQDRDGEVLVVNWDGTILRIRPAP
jgi:glucose/arabinose dehydrogenase